MLGYLILVALQFAIAFLCAPFLLAKIPITGDPKTFVHAAIYALIVWVVGLVGSFALKDVRTPGTSTLVSALVGGLIGAELHAGAGRDADLAVDREVSAALPPPRSCDRGLSSATLTQNDRKKGARPEDLAPFLCSASFLPTVASMGWGTSPAVPRKGRAQTMPSTMAVTKQNDMIAASTFIRILRSIVYSFGRRGCPAWSLRWFNSSFAGAP